MKKNAFTVRAAFKAAGIIAAVAMVGFSMMGCPTEDEGPNWGNPPDALVGTWEQGSATIKIDSDGTLSVSSWGTGTYQTADDNRFKATIAGGSTEGTYTLKDSGKILNLKFDDTDMNQELGGDWDKQ